MPVRGVAPDDEEAEAMSAVDQVNAMVAAGTLRICRNSNPISEKEAQLILDFAAQLEGRTPTTEGEPDGTDPRTDQHRYAETDPVPTLRAPQVRRLRGQRGAAGMTSRRDDVTAYEAAAGLEKSLAKVQAILGTPTGGLLTARDVVSELAYRQRILAERVIAQAHLGVLLDDWCRSYGWDPNVWRLPLGHDSDRARLDRDIAEFRAVKRYELGLDLRDLITIHGATS